MPKTFSKKTKIPFIVPEKPSFILFILSILKIWRRSYFTNFGQEYHKLIQKFSNFFNTKNLAICCSGTIAEEIILSLIKEKDNLKNEIITTPYSFIASSNAILRSGLKPLFIDIDNNFSLDHKLLEKVITNKTLAIIIVDVYGIPNDYSSIKRIADKYSIPIIADKSHSLGVIIDGQSSLIQSDFSFASLHATKIISALEGGIIYSKSNFFIEKISKYMNFGFENNDAFSFGTNAKIDEFRCAFASNLMNQIPGIIKKRKAIFKVYVDYGLGKYLPKVLIDFEKTGNWNYSYFPILVKKNKRNHLFNELTKNGITSKKYFDKVIPDFNIYKDNPEKWLLGSNLNISRNFAECVLSLPIYSSLSFKKAKKIASIVKENL